eukprot:5348343-Alexandrium_andersonii.AAC.1
MSGFKDVRFRVGRSTFRMLQRLQCRSVEADGVVRQPSARVMSRHWAFSARHLWCPACHAAWKRRATP